MAKKILVVDDEIDLLKLVKRCLERCNYKISTAESGEEALNKIYAESPDLVILDINMPNMSGLEVCKRIRTDPLYKKMRIVMLTVKAADTDKVKGLNIGADEYLAKPFIPKELVLRVKNILGE